MNLTPMNKKIRETIPIVGSNGRSYNIALTGQMVIDFSNGPKVQISRKHAPPSRPVSSGSTRNQSGHNVPRTELRRRPDYRLRRVHSGTAIDQPDEAEYHTPVGNQSFESHVRVPVSLALAVSAPLAFAGFVFGLGSQYNPLYTALLMGGLSFLGMVIWRVRVGDKQMLQKEIFRATPIREAEEPADDQPGERQVPINKGDKTYLQLVKETVKGQGKPSPDDWKKFGRAMSQPKYRVRGEFWSRRKITERGLMTQGEFNKCAESLRRGGYLSENAQGQSRLTEEGWKFIANYLPHPEDGQGG